MTAIKIHKFEKFYYDYTTYYILEKYQEKNGTWYRKVTLAPAIKYHFWKNYRNRHQAYYSYAQEIVLHEWRVAGLPDWNVKELTEAKAKELEALEVISK